MEKPLKDEIEDLLLAGLRQRIPGSEGFPTRVLVSNLGDGALQLVEVAKDGTMRSLDKAKVGKAPKRVAFVPPPA